MQVSVEKTSELSRKMTVTLPEELVEEKVQARLKSTARDVKLKGFRPGKVPQHVVKKMYGAQIRSEVMGELIQSSYYEALQDKDQRPAGPPNIVPSDQVEEGQGFEYFAEYEVYPSISLDNLEQVTVETKTAEVGDADLDLMLEKLREQKKEWQESDQASAENDRLTLSFSGTSEDKNFTDGEVKDFEVVIGEKKMIPGFEEELIGLNAGDSKTFDITFPEDYGNKDLAGKVATFDIEVAKVENASIPEIDTDFMKDYGIENGDMDAFRAEIKSNMVRELARAVRASTKTAVLDALYEQVEFALPKTMIDQEIESQMKPIKENAAKQNKQLSELDLPAEMFEEQAKRRVALSLIMSEILVSNELKVDADRVRTMIEELAQSYEQPEELVNYYYGDEKRLEEVQQLVLEEQAVDWVLEQVKITSQTVDFESLMNQNQAQ